MLPNLPLTPMSPSYLSPELRTRGNAPLPKDRGALQRGKEPLQHRKHKDREPRKNSRKLAGPPHLLKWWPGPLKTTTQLLNQITLATLLKVNLLAENAIETVIDNSRTWQRR